MKEMSERIDAMDQITHNMDREFKSSRVVSLIKQSRAGELERNVSVLQVNVNPAFFLHFPASICYSEYWRSVKPLIKSFVLQRIRWVPSGNAPEMGGPRPMEKRRKNVDWKASSHEAAENRRYTLNRVAEGIHLLDNVIFLLLLFLFLLVTDAEDSIDVDVNRAEKDVAAAETDVEEDKEGEPDNEDIGEQIDSEKDEQDQDEQDGCFEQDQEDGEVIVSSSVEKEKYSDHEQPRKQRQDSSETEVKSSAEKEKVPSVTQDSER